MPACWPHTAGGRAGTRRGTATRSSSPRSAASSSSSSTSRTRPATRRTRPPHKRRWTTWTGSPRRCRVSTPCTSAARIKSLRPVRPRPCPYVHARHGMLTRTTALMTRVRPRRLDHVTLGALADSFYEYELKQYLLTGKTEVQFRRMCTAFCVCCADPSTMIAPLTCATGTRQRSPRRRVGRGRPCAPAGPKRADHLPRRASQRPPVWRLGPPGTIGRRSPVRAASAAHRQGRRPLFSCACATGHPRSASSRVCWPWVRPSWTGPRTWSWRSSSRRHATACTASRRPGSGRRSSPLGTTASTRLTAASTSCDQVNVR